MPLEVDLMKVWVIGEEEEGKAEKEGTATGRYFRRNQLTRAWGGARQAGSFDLLLWQGHICQIPAQFQHHWWTCGFSDS